jgi:GDP-4-dehydro-6-deoxy-D-mannose reductase
MTKTILITGAAGFTGMHACQYFSDKGYRVIGLSRKENLDLKWQMETCDLLDMSEIQLILKKYKPDYCLHLAGINSVPKSWSEPISALNINVMGTLYLLEAIRLENPICRIVVSGSALSEANHPYALSKYFQQKLSLEWANLFNLAVMVAKPCNLIGPGRSAGFVSVLAERIAEIEKMNKPYTIEVSHLENEREFLDVRDVIRAYDVILKSGTPNTIYEIGSGKSHTLRDVASVYQDLSSIDLSFISSGSSPDHPPRLMHTSKIKDLNWQTTYSLVDSISHTLTYFRDHLVE